MAFRASILGGLAALFFSLPAAAGWVSIGGNPQYEYVGPDGKSQWSDPAARTGIFDDTASKTTNVKHNYPLNWNNVLNDINNRYPTSTVIEKTKKIPWADVGTAAGKSIIRNGPKAIGWIGIGSVIISAGYDVCKAVQGDWCTDSPIKPDTVPSDVSVTWTEDANGKYFTVSPSYGGGCTPAYNCDANEVLQSNKLTFVTAWGCTAASLPTDCTFTVSYSGSANNERAVPATEVATAVDSSVSLGNKPSDVANDILTHDPDLASSTNPAVQYAGPASVSSDPIRTTENLTNPDGTTTVREATQSSTANISYGDSVTVNNISTTTNITENGTVVNNTTTTTTPTPSPTTTEEGLATEATLSKVLGELQGTPTAPNYSSAESAQQGAYDGIKNWAEKAPERKPYGDGIQWSFQFPAATCQNLQYNIPLVGMAGEFDICTPIATIRNILYWFFAVLTIFAIYNLWFIRTR